MSDTSRRRWRPRGEVGGAHGRAAGTARRARRPSGAAPGAGRRAGSAAQLDVRAAADPDLARLGPHRRHRLAVRHRHPRPAHRHQLPGLRPAACGPCGRISTRRPRRWARRSTWGGWTAGTWRIWRPASRTSTCGPSAGSDAGCPRTSGALGKALLAERPDDELPEGPYEALTPNTHTTRDALLADLAEVRARGYSIDREEGVLGIVGFGFALRYDSPAQDAISCSVPVARLTPEHEAADRRGDAGDQGQDRGDGTGRRGRAALALTPAFTWEGPLVYPALPTPNATCPRSHPPGFFPEPRA